jgi:uncharacterized membrane protein
LASKYLISFQQETNLDYVNMNQVARNYTIDILRGFAIITMIGSNLAGELLKLPHPIYVTIFGSMAAPFFIILAGYLVTMGVREKEYGFSYFFIRGVLTILTGAIIDSLLWGIFPFFSIDVLYLTGSAIILTYFFTKLSLDARIILTLVLFLAGPLVRNYFSYTELPPSYFFKPKDGQVSSDPISLFQYIKLWLIDGWFPFFSWLGISFLGSLFYEIKRKKLELSDKFYFYSILFSLLLISIGSYLIPIENRYLVRGTYTELFYPPTLSYYMHYIPFMLILCLLVDYNSHLIIYVPFKIIGMSPMFFYFFHFVLISKFAIPYWGKKRLNDLNEIEYFKTYGAILIICYLFSFLLKWIKMKWEKPPFIVKFFIGG